MKPKERNFFSCFPGGSFFRSLEKTSEKVYLVLLCFYLAVFLNARICWTSPLDKVMVYVRVAMMSIVIWGTALYFFAFAADWRGLWKRTGLLAALAVPVFGGAGIFSRSMTMRTFNQVVDLWFCFFACGKSFRRIMKCSLCTVAGALFAAGIGELAGFTMERPKPERAVAGLSLGTIYPNTWAYLVFLAAMILWYLITEKKDPAAPDAGKRKRQEIPLSFAAFWALGILIFFVTTSRTVAALCLMFPVLYLAVERQESVRGKNGGPSPGAVFWILFAFLCFVLTMVLCWQMEWVHDHFYHTFLHTMAMRFVEGGNILRMNGIPLIGHSFELNTVQTGPYGDEIEFIIDNTYVTYLILRGAVWIACCLCWLAAAHYKCLKKGDRRLLAVSAAVLLLGLMERPALDVWYNTVLLYPLAAASYGHTERWTHDPQQPEKTEQAEQVS